MSRSFFLGAGVSAHQTEGDNTHSDWWNFEQETLSHLGKDVSGKAVEHAKHYKEDIELLASSGLNAYRCSIEWAKVMPREGTIDKKALHHYRHVLHACKKKQLKTMVTLWHFSLPEWASLKGGWLSKDVRRAFITFVMACRDELWKDVDYWITLNEPMVYIYEGYRWGRWPPRKKNMLQGIRVLFALARVHHDAYEVLQGTSPIGIAKHYIAFRVQKKVNAYYRFYRVFKSWIWNQAFYVLTQHVHDFIGINYYFIEWIGPKPKAKEVDDMGWEMRPEGLEQAIKDMYRYHLPIVITENGIATTDDKKRIEYIDQHVRTAWRLREQYDVRGYLYWSLLDNFEWDKGYAKRFGLIAVDRENMKRTPKPSLKAFGALRTSL